MEYRAETSADTAPIYSCKPLDNAIAQDLLCACCQHQQRPQLRSPLILFHLRVRHLNSSDLDLDVSWWRIQARILAQPDWRTRLALCRVAGRATLNSLRRFRWPSIRAKALSRQTSSPQCFAAPLGSQRGGGPKL